MDRTIITHRTAENEIHHIFNIRRILVGNNIADYSKYSWNYIFILD